MGKKILYIGTILLFTLSSCVKKQLWKESDSSNCLISAHMEVSWPTTRTSLQPDGTKVVWSNYDAISLISVEGAKKTFTLVSGSGETTGVFGGVLDGMAPYTVFYPASGNASISESVLSFQLPHSQVYNVNSFGRGSMPMVGTLDDTSTPMQFKNICGILCLKLTTKPAITLSQLVIRDLDGNMLWGNAHLALDGTQGSAGQTLTLDGGSDEIILTMPSGVELSESVPTTFYVVVPPGSFSGGFSVTVYGQSEGACASFQTKNAEAVIERATITDMPNKDFRPEAVDPAKRGYYKDLFMDSGIKLNCFTTLAAFPYLGLDFEYFATTVYYSDTAEDRANQQKFFAWADDDENGYLLYPDRQPRFRTIYVNGGELDGHATTLGADGRQSIYDYVYNGGSYVGTCAGAYIACMGGWKSAEGVNNSKWYHIYPGYMYWSTISADTYTDLTFVDPATNPLRGYYSFGDVVLNTRHHNGGWLLEKEGMYPPETEILMRYSNCPAGHEVNNDRVAVLAYKPSESTGRMVLCGSHPEKGVDGDIRNLFSAMLLYAMDGNGVPPVKAILTKGETYDCTALSSANTPAHARIGDKQYHHFKVTIPEGAHDVQISLASLAGFEDDDLYVSLRKDDYAWFSEADYSLTTDGTTKILSVPGIIAGGTYYVSVYSPNTVTTSVASYSTGQYIKYSGKTHLLNGIPYTITVNWDCDHKDGGNENFKGQDDLGDDFEFEFD